MAQIGLGARLSLGDGVSSAFVDFYTQTISLPQQEIEYVESTYLNQGHSRRTYVTGLIGAGDCAYEVQYNSADLARLYAVVGIEKNWQITLPDSSTAAFTGIASTPGMDVSADQVMVIKGNIRVTSDIDFDEGA